MLKIEGDITGLVKFAEENGSLEALLAKLTYLNRWGEAYKDRVLTKVNIWKKEFDEAGVTFYSSTGEVRMCGGLVFHKETLHWGVHT